MNKWVNLTNLGQNTSAADIQAGFPFLSGSNYGTCPSYINSIHLAHRGKITSRLHKDRLRGIKVFFKHTLKEKQQSKQWHMHAVCQNHLGNSYKTEPQRHPTNHQPIQPVQIHSQCTETGLHILCYSVASLGPNTSVPN